ncbi:hypothetical protein JVT61DRAFT_14391 [Boletus reticuloceps]|uniref:Uncharacterized protein n=1 Tax=Boletus reticuloceps TaxID=495285 RepID=A0A8I2YTA4_9AGAM|nr:hypothetical protein JVT61DRAFT_14391 [Boletus reticuloceps]
MQQIIKLTLSHQLGVGFSGHLEDFITNHCLKRSSEDAIYHKQNLSTAREPEDELSDWELDQLYPLKLAKAISEEESATAWKGKQIGAVIIHLQTMPTYEDNATKLWTEETERKAMAKQCEMNHYAEYQKIKVFQSSCINRAKEVAKWQKSKIIIT